MNRGLLIGPLSVMMNEYGDGGGVRIDGKAKY